MMTDAVYTGAEEEIFKMPEGQAKQRLMQLLTQCMTLEHRLVDPNFMYAGGRATRLSIVSRNAEIDALRKEIKDHQNVIGTMRLKLELADKQLSGE